MLYFYWTVFGWIIALYIAELLEFQYPDLCTFYEIINVHNSHGLLFCTKFVH